MAKRYIRAKSGELRAAFGKGYSYDEGSIKYAWGGGGADSPDARILARTIEDTPIYDGRTLVEELERRGYDISTLRFSIQQKRP